MSFADVYYIVSLSRRVHYRRLHCICKASIEYLKITCGCLHGMRPFVLVNVFLVTETKAASHMTHT